MKEWKSHGSYHIIIEAYSRGYFQDFSCSRLGTARILSQGYRTECFLKKVGGHVGMSGSCCGVDTNYVGSSLGSLQSMCSKCQRRHSDIVIVKKTG